MKLPEAIASKAQKWGYIPGIYFLILEGEIVYIGASVNVPTRIGTHRSTKKFDSAFWITVKISDLPVYEGVLIRRFNPPLNYGANPAYHGRDNEILGLLGLPLHEDERAAAVAHSADFSRARCEQMRESRAERNRSRRRHARREAENKRREAVKAAEATDGAP